MIFAGFLSRPLRRSARNLQCRRCYPRYSREEIKDAYNELYALTEAGELFSSDYDGTETKVSLSGAPIKALCLNVAHDCNMRCEYCFAKTGDFGTGRKIMDFETAKAAIDFVIARSGNAKTLKSTFSAESR